MTRVGEHCVGFHNGFVGRGAGIAADAGIAAGHRFHVVRAQFLEMAGDPAAVRTAYLGNWSGSFSAAAGNVCPISVQAGQSGDSHRLA